MTREEAKSFLQCRIELIDKYYPDIKDYREALDMAIKALEQDPIIYKIRAEIIMYEGDCRLSVDEYPSCKQCTDNVFKTIYGILDKYNAESEE